MIARKRPNIEIQSLIPEIKRRDGNDIDVSRIINDEDVLRYMPHLSKCPPPPPTPKVVLDEDSLHEITSISTILHSLKDRIFQLKNKNISLQQDNNILMMSKNDNIEVIEEQKRSLNRAILQSRAMQELIEGLSVRLGNMGQLKLQIIEKKDSIQALIKDLSERKNILLAERETILARNCELQTEIKEINAQNQKDKEKWSKELCFIKEEKDHFEKDYNSLMEKISQHMLEEENLVKTIRGNDQTIENLECCIKDHHSKNISYKEEIATIIKNLYEKYTLKQESPPLGDLSNPSSLLESLETLLEESKSTNEESLLNLKVDFDLLTQNFTSLTKEYKERKEELIIMGEQISKAEEEIEEKTTIISSLEERVISQQRNLSMNMDKISSLQNSHSLSLTLKECLFKTNKEDILLFDEMTFEEQEQLVKQAFNHQICKRELSKSKEKLSQVLLEKEEAQEMHFKKEEEMREDEKRWLAQIDTLRDENDDLRKRLIGLKVLNDKSGKDDQHQQQQQHQPEDKSLQGLLSVINQSQSTHHNKENATTTTTELKTSAASSSSSGTSTTSSDLWNVFSTVKRKKNHIQHQHKPQPQPPHCDPPTKKNNVSSASARRRKRKINFTP